MIQILIKVIAPNNEKPWRVSLNKGRPKSKKNVVSVFSHVERFLSQKLLTSSASEVGYKIKVLVDHSATQQEKPMTTLSEGLYSEKNEALYWLASFLEDYLPNRYLKIKYKLYGNTKSGGESNG